MDIEHITIISFAVILILLLTPHSFQVFKSFSLVKDNRVKNFQAAGFSIVVSASILFFVVTGRVWLSLFGAFVELALNFYYFTQDYWQSTFWRRGDEVKPPKWVWQHRIPALFIAIIMVIFIYIYSHIL